MQRFFSFTSARSRAASATLALTGVLLLAVSESLAQANTRVSRILGMFDINGRGGPDRSVDSDGDGLPDTWEVGGIDPEDTDVPFPAPQAIIPGTPPQSIFARTPVRTSATSRDTDGDGLSDFIEVFGLKFIDDNGNGILDDATARDGAGNIIRDANGIPQRATDANGNPIGDWFDFNQDGMPSIGEYPAVNILLDDCGNECHDFDGFMFTDPISPDTDGDGVSDGEDNDPLINPASFGQQGSFFATNPDDPTDTDRDLDNDGLGNGMDLGNDVDLVLDNPGDLQRVLEVFRQDLLVDANGRPLSVVRVPEGLIEDLLGADWNGDGLFRLTDLKDPEFGVVAGDEPDLAAGFIELFEVQDPDAVVASAIQLGFAVSTFPDDFNFQTYYRASERGPAGVDAPLPFQTLLVPAGRNDNVFLPDPRIWTVLYSWRMPGFDIDGNGFIGFDSRSFQADITVDGESASAADRAGATNIPATEIVVSGAQGAVVTDLDGVVQADFGTLLCPLFGGGLLSVGLIGVCASGTRRTDRAFRRLRVPRKIEKAA